MGACPANYSEWNIDEKSKPMMNLVSRCSERTTDVLASTSVKTTPQMTRFRDVKVCNNLVTDEIDDHRIQSDYKCTIGLQYPEGKNSTLSIAFAW